MQNKTSDYPLLIVGAGAAGLGASARATDLGMNHLVIEASHRIGGRGLTERLDNRIPVDLGCHWMHCASQNPYVEEADRLGFVYSSDNPIAQSFVGGKWQNEKYSAARSLYLDLISSSACVQFQRDSDSSIWDCFDQDNEFVPWASYWFGLLHSNDPDLVSVSDLANFNDTHEDWAVQDGYGALIAAAGNGAPVQLNAPVRKINWAGSSVRVDTSEGTVSADKVLVTVSTGILGARDISFSPTLPSWKQQAIEELPMGNYNYYFFTLDPGAIADAPPAIAYQNGETSLLIWIRPFGYPYLFSCTAGRFAWWLEKQGERTTENWFREILLEIFGSELNQALGRFKASAWGYDPWIKGAYSSCRPGAGNQRAALARSLHDKLFFAGEATSENTFNTAHGAWLAGQASVSAIFADSNPDPAVR